MSWTSRRRARSGSGAGCSMPRTRAQCCQADVKFLSFLCYNAPRRNSKKFTSLHILLEAELPAVLHLTSRCNAVERHRERTLSFKFRIRWIKHF
jgi:hypothetical protein